MLRYKGIMTPQQFKGYRTMMNLTQRELGIALGLSRVSVNRIEAGLQAITPHVAVQVGVMVALFKQGGRQ